MALRPSLAPPERRQTPDFGLAQVNIVLLLVLFFLVSGTIVESDEQGVPLPETEDLPLDRLPRPLVVLNDEGWTLDGSPVAPEDLVAALALADSAPADAPVHLLAPRDAPAERVLEAMQVLSPSGREVRLVTVTVSARPGETNDAAAATDTSSGSDP